MTNLEIKMIFREGRDDDEVEITVNKQIFRKIPRYNYKDITLDLQRQRASNFGEALIEIGHDIVRQARFGETAEHHIENIRTLHFF